MATMKAVMDTKRALDDFLRQHPELVNRDTMLPQASSQHRHP
jgi:hypothetical protein